MDPEFDDEADLCNGGGGGHSGARNFVKSGGLIMKVRIKVHAYYTNYLTMSKEKFDVKLSFDI